MLLKDMSETYNQTIKQRKIVLSRRGSQKAITYQIPPVIFKPRTGLFGRGRPLQARAKSRFQAIAGRKYKTHDEFKNAINITLLLGAESNTQENSGFL